MYKLYCCSAKLKCVIVHYLLFSNINLAFWNSASVVDLVTRILHSFPLCISRITAALLSYAPHPAVRQLLKSRIYMQVSWYATHTHVRRVCVCMCVRNLCTIKQLYTVVYNSLDFFITCDHAMRSRGEGKSAWKGFAYFKRLATTSGKRRKAAERVKEKEEEREKKKKKSCKRIMVIFATESTSGFSESRDVVILIRIIENAAR